MRELSIFIDESGDFGPYQQHSPFYVLSLVFHDQRDDIAPNLEAIHQALRDRGLPPGHAVHTGPLIRRENDYRWLDLSARRSIFSVLVNFARTCGMTHRSWVFSKRGLGDADRLIGRMSRDVGAFLQENTAFFSGWDRIVIYYDNGQKEVTNLVNIVFNAHLSNVEVRKALPSDYTLFQVADLCCTLALLRSKMDADGLSKSEDDFFSTRKLSAARSLRKGYFRTMDGTRFTG